MESGHFTFFSSRSPKERLGVGGDMYIKSLPTTIFRISFNKMVDNKTRMVDHKSRLVNQLGTGKYNSLDFSIQKLR